MISAVPRSKIGVEKLRLFETMSARDGLLTLNRIAAQLVYLKVFYSHTIHFPYMITPDVLLGAYLYP